MIRDLDIDIEDLANGGMSRSRTRSGEFHEIFSGQLLHEPLQLKAEESRRDRATWQIAFRRDLVDRRFSRFNRIINSSLLIRERRQWTHGRFRSWFGFRQENLEIIENVVGVHDEFCALLDQSVGANRARRIDVTGHGVDRAALLERLRRGDERAAVRAGFDNQDSMTPTRDNSITHRKGLT